MATELKITDGTNTLTFDGVTDGRIVRYDPTTPPQRVQQVEHATEEGERIVDVKYRNVDETCELLIEGATTVAIGNKLQQLQRLLEQARRSNRDNVESRVFVQIKPDGYSTWYESEIFRGFYQPEIEGVGMYISRLKLIVEVSWERRYYWEAVTESQLTISNTGGSGTSLTLYNAADAYLGGRYNWFDVLMSATDGDLPAPGRLVVQNLSSPRIRRIWVGQKYTGAPASIGYTLDIVDKTGSGSGSQQPGAADYTKYNKGFYWEDPFTTTTEQTILQWTVSSTVLTAARGGFFKLLANAPVRPSGGLLRVRARAFVEVTPIWDGPWVYPDRAAGDLLDLGSLRIPPYPARSGSLYPINLSIYGQLDATGSETIGIDFLRLVPLDSWRMFDSFAYDLGQNAYIVDDPYEEWVYTDGWATAGRLGNFNSYGPKLMISNVPGLGGRNRYVVTFTDWNGDVLAGSSVSVSMYYRARRLSL